MADDTVSANSSHTVPNSGVGPQDQLPIPDTKAEDTDDWDHSPNNPRNWSPLKKWTATALVRSHLSFLSPR